MQYTLLPVLLFVACTLGLAIALLILSRFFNPGCPGRVARMPYESGMDPIHDTRRRFDVRFHLLAIAFLIFDVELLFLYPWAVAMNPEVAGEKNLPSPIGRGAGGEGCVNQKSLAPDPCPLSPPQGIDYAVAQGWVQNRDIVFAGAAVFMLLLILGYIYDWRKGIFSPRGVDGERLLRR